MTELELTAALEQSGRIKGLDNWIRFNARKGASEFADTVIELREARRLANENPNSVIHIANETNAPKRPGTDQTMKDFDIAIVSKQGGTEGSAEVKSIADKVTKAPDLSSGGKHAAEKAGESVQENAPIKGKLDAIVEAELAIGTSKAGNTTIEISADGNSIQKAGNGKIIKTDNIFDSFTLQIPKIQDSELLSRVTIVDRSG